MNEGCEAKKSNKIIRVLTDYVFQLTEGLIRTSYSK